MEHILSVAYTGQVIDTLNANYPKGTAFKCLKNGNDAVSTGLFIINKKGKGFVVYEGQKTSQIYQYVFDLNKVDKYAELVNDVPNSPEKVKQLILAYCKANYPVGTIFESSLSRQKVHVSDNDFIYHEPEGDVSVGCGSVIPGREGGHFFVRHKGTYADKLGASDFRKTVVKVNNVVEATAVIAYLASKGFVSQDHEDVVKSILHGSFPRYLATESVSAVNDKLDRPTFEKYFKEIEFREYALSNNLSEFMPLIKSVDGQDLYKKDKYFNVYKDENGKWVVSAMGRLNVDHICMPGVVDYDAFPFRFRENAKEYCRQMNYKVVEITNPNFGVKVRVSSEGEIKFDQPVVGMSIEVLSDIQDALLSFCPPEKHEDVERIEIIDSFNDKLCMYKNPLSESSVNIYMSSARGFLASKDQLVEIKKFIECRLK